MDELRLYQRLPVRTIKRSLIPIILCILGIIWLTHTNAASRSAATKVFVLVTGVWAAFRVVRISTFFALSYRKPILTVTERAIRVRNATLPWSAVSKIEALQRHGQTLVGIYPTSSHAFLQTLNGLEQSFYSQQLKGFSGALPIPPIKGLTPQQVVQVLESYRNAVEPVQETAGSDLSSPNGKSAAVPTSTGTPSYLRPASLSIVVAIAIFVGLATARGLRTIVTAKSMNIATVVACLVPALAWSVGLSIFLFVLLTLIVRLETRKVE